MALADKLSIDRLRTGTRERTQRVRARIMITPPAAAGAGRRADRAGMSSQAAMRVAMAAVVLPWMSVVISRWLLTPPSARGRGMVIGDPWSLLSPSWGAYALIGLLVAFVYALVVWARGELGGPDLQAAAMVGIVALAGFVIWCAAAVWWSQSPAGAWRWTVVMLGALLAAGLGAFVGSERGGRRGVAIGLVLVGGLTALIGLIDLLAFPGLARRVVSPLDPTMNGLATAIAVLVCLGLDGELHPQQRRWTRGIATLCLVALVFTGSRGAVVIELVGLVMLASLRRPLSWPLVQVIAGALPAVLVGLLGAGVARAGAPDTTSRGLVAVLIAFGVLTVSWNAARDTGAPGGLAKVLSSWRTWAALAALCVVGILIAGAMKPGGIRGTYDRTHADLTVRSVSGTPTDTSRYWSGSTDGRTWRWQAAIDDFQHGSTPLTGSGPGTSAQTLRRYRTDANPALTTSSAPLAILTETGIVGSLLVVLVFVGLGLGAWRQKIGDERAVLGTVIVVTLLHSIWTDDILQPLALFPMFLALGALASRPSVERVLAPLPVDRGVPARRTWGAAIGALAAIVVAAGALSPARAQLKAREAEVALQRGTPDSIHQAAVLADQATQLDPLSHQGPAMASAAALAQGRILDARRDALLAVKRAPKESSAWLAVANVTLAGYDRAGARTAARSLLFLDPAGPQTKNVAILATQASAPPEASPTAIGTPLSPTR